MPPQVAAMLQGVSHSGTQVATSGASQELSDAWRSKVLPLCEPFNRYPMVAGSTADVPVDDFARLLAPGGMMDQFFNQYLKPFVDTTQRPWKWQSADHMPLGLSADLLVAVRTRRPDPRRAVRQRHSRCRCASNWSRSRSIPGSVRSASTSPARP